MEQLINALKPLELTKEQKNNIVGAIKDYVDKNNFFRKIVYNIVGAAKYLSNDSITIEVPYTSEDSASTICKFTDVLKLFKVNNLNQLNKLYILVERQIGGKICDQYLASQSIVDGMLLHIKNGNEIQITQIDDENVKISMPGY